MNNHFKQCNTCSQFKDLAEYNADSTREDGLDVKCRDCRHIENANRMYVNGQYVPRKHPLWRAGRYRTFEDAAFEALPNYRRDPRGQVYIITNDAWRGWVKVGKAVDANDRLNSYQTSSPLRDYKLYAAWTVDDRNQSERVAHSVLDGRFEKQNEWFKVDADVAASLLEEVL